MTGMIHFNILFNGNTHRFTPTGMDIDMIMGHVATLVGDQDVELLWNDGDSNVVLETEEDLSAAVEYAKCTTKSPTEPLCVELFVAHNSEDEAEKMNENLRKLKIAYEDEDEGSQREDEEDDEDVVVEEANDEDKENAFGRVVASEKEHVNVVFIGHVDAGKSTIGGQIMVLTGRVDQRTLDRHRREAKEMGRESWYLSWVVDTGDEERSKGTTVECGRAYFETNNRRFTLLDAPGHKTYITNMIDGASQADLAVLVISARKGEFETGFERGQTKEHAMLVKTSGVKQLVILVNKMDDPSVEWDEERFNEIRSLLTPYLRKCGFNPKTDIAYIPCSGLTGAFLKERPTNNDGAWYSGPCFLDYIDSVLPTISRDSEGAVRCIIHNKHDDMGTVIMGSLQVPGMVVEGKIESGCVVNGQKLVIMPKKVAVQVVQCWSEDVEKDRIVCGENFRFKLKVAGEPEIQSGYILCAPDNLCNVTRLFDAEVVILEHDAGNMISAGYSCVMHIQSATMDVVVKNVICTKDKRTGEKKKAKFAKKGEKVVLRLQSFAEFCIETFEDFPLLGRFTLRLNQTTIAIGKVVKIVEHVENSAN